jgi:hypothetical protein
LKECKKILKTKCSSKLKILKNNVVTISWLPENFSYKALLRNKKVAGVARLIFTLKYLGKESSFYVPFSPLSLVVRKLKTPKTQNGITWPYTM